MIFAFLTFESRHLNSIQNENEDEDESMQRISKKI